MILSRPRLHRIRMVAAVLFWPALVFVVWGELAPDPETGALGWLSEINDKVLHFLAYFGLAAIAGMAMRNRWRVAWAVASLIAMGAALEYVQGLVGRDKDWFDALANGGGAILGGLLARFVVEPLRRRFPSG